MDQHGLGVGSEEGKSIPAWISGIFIFGKNCPILEEDLNLTGLLKMDSDSLNIIIDTFAY